MKIIYDAEGNQVGTVRRTHGCLNTLGWIFVIPLMLGLPLQASKPWVYIVAPVVYSAEVALAVWYIKQRRQRKQNGNP